MALAVMVTLALAGAPLRASVQDKAGTVTGRVLDAEGRPVAAAVGLAGTEFVTRTDSAGRFSIESVPPGDYLLVAQFTDLAAFGLAGAERPLRVTGREPSRARLFLAPRSVQLSRLCDAVSPTAPAGDDPAGSATVFGRVVDQATGRPGDSVEVWIGTADWVTGSVGVGDAEERWAGMVVPADSTGRFLACRLPAGLDVIAQAGTHGAASDTVHRRTDPGAPILLELETTANARLLPAFATVDAPEALDAVVDDIVSEPASRAADQPAEEEIGGLATLVGTVLSAEDGQPVAGARVRLVGHDLERITSPQGAFVFPDLPRGRYAVVTERLGLASDTAEVDLRFGSGTVASLLLETRPVRLPDLVVDVQRSFVGRRLAGYYRRMDRGLGDFVTREDLRYRDVIGGLRRIPGVRLEQCVSALGLRTTDCYDIKIARGYSAGLTAACPPLVYINGVLRTTSLGVGRNAFSILQSLPTDMIEGIEVYRSPTMAPPRYRMRGDLCGIILVWLRGR